MKFKKACTLFALVLTAASAQASVEKSGTKQIFGQGPKVEAVPGEYVVQLSSSLSVRSASQVLAQSGFSLAETVHAGTNVHLVKAKSPRGFVTQQALRTLSLVPGVVVAEPNFIYRKMTNPERTPNDPSLNSLWAMKNSGQRDPTGRAGKAGADIKATEAWALNTGSKNVVVAVIDTGVDYNHPDLRPNMWIKPKANPSDPDIFGFNAINGKEDPMDDNAHGSHCAGTIGAHGDNAQGVVGVAWNLSIMGVKFLSGSGSGTLADAIKAIDYATQNGAQIMSNSWGGGGFSQTLRDAIVRARDKGILFVAAAGNDGSSNDSQPTYPASYDVDNIISVAASNNLDNMASFSNYGTRTVHLMAPGENILSSTPNNRYQSFSGTSMATPHVSGAAALLLAHEPSLTYTELKDRILKSTDKWKGLKRKVVSSGRLNVFNMLASIFPPGPIQIPDSAWNVPVPQNIQTPSPYKENLNLSWTIENPGVKFMRVRFARFSTEAGYDIVTIKDKEGNVVDQLSGNLADNTWSSEVEGDRLIIEFKSDESVPGAGFAIDAYQWTNYSGNAE